MKEAFALYLGESIMFPTIFSLALRDAGTKTKLASSLLIMTIMGGAVAPVIFRKPTRPSLPLRKAPPFSPSLSFLRNERM